MELSVARSRATVLRIEGRRTRVPECYANSAAIQPGFYRETCVCEHYERVRVVSMSESLVIASPYTAGPQAGSRRCPRRRQARLRSLRSSGNDALAPAIQLAAENGDDRVIRANAA